MSLDILPLGNIGLEDTPHFGAHFHLSFIWIIWISAPFFNFKCLEIALERIGETAKLHLKVFEGSSVPSPIEIMVFLVLGWLFVLIGDYKEMRLKNHLQ